MNDIPPYTPPGTDSYCWIGSIRYIDRDRVQLEVISRELPPVMVTFTARELRDLFLEKQKHEGDKQNG